MFGGAQYVSCRRPCHANMRPWSPPFPATAPDEHHLSQHHGRLRRHRGKPSTTPPLMACTHSVALQALHRTIPPFAPYVPVGLLPYLAFVLLMTTFVLAFYFSTYVHRPCVPSTHTNIHFLVYQKQLYLSASSQSHPQPASWEGSESWHCSAPSACICSALRVEVEYTVVWAGTLRS